MEILPMTKSDFTISGSSAYERTNRLVAVDPDNGKTTSGGMYNNGVPPYSAETLRILKYIDTTTGSADEICTTFATQSQTQNYEFVWNLRVSIGYRLQKIETPPVDDGDLYHRVV